MTKTKLTTEHHLYFVVLKPEDEEKGEERTRLVAQLDRSDEDELYINIGGVVYYASFQVVEAIMKCLSDDDSKTPGEDVRPIAPSSRDG